VTPLLEGKGPQEILVPPGDYGRFRFAFDAAARGFRRNSSARQLREVVKPFPQPKALDRFPLDPAARPIE
jgi:hypothetical protein